jgi:hypothetical protein
MTGHNRIPTKRCTVMRDVWCGIAIAVVAIVTILLVLP